ncbi:hypothetical protein [Natrinema salinisoli]|uniref:hypothetical protein n=1 Tax=Natrinema salinisoli TaxID=2878535 RepID=UPI001CEFCEA1|nr:hypothetical protein [Natrinema salinisoli]
MSTTLTSDQEVIRCYNKPAISEDLQARLTAEGLFVADYNNGRSLESSAVPDDNRRSAAGLAFNRIETITQEGGIGLIRTPNDDDKIITVGEWKPNCATFKEIDGTQLKGIQMARYGLIVPSDELYNKLDGAFDTGGKTVIDVDDYQDTIEKAINTLEREGRLRKPAYF